MKISEGRYKCNKWKIYEGNCIEILDNEVVDNSVDCIVTSPPYWGKRAYGKEFGRDGNITLWEYGKSGAPVEGEIGNGCSYKEYIEDMKKVIGLMYKKLKSNKFAFINISTWHEKNELIDVSHDFIEIAKEVGFNHWDTIIWIKRNSMPPGKYKDTYLSNGWEYVLAFTKGKQIRIIDGNYYLTNSHFVCKNCGKDNHLDLRNHPNYFYSNVGCYGRKRRPIRHHSAPFPIEVPTFCFSLSTNKNDIILDPFAGSGTTLISGLQLGLNVIGCELMPYSYSNIVEELLSMK